MTKYFIVPGLGNSGEKHWQTWMEEAGTNFVRIQQSEWEAPRRMDWTNTIDKTLDKEDLQNIVLIGHSLGCAAIIHWTATNGKIIKGAFLVAPSDPEGVGYKFPATGFTPLPFNKVPFKTIVVASEDDQWVTIERARHFANSWGSDFVNIGNAGHINAISGHWKWKFGMDLLRLYFD